MNEKPEEFDEEEFKPIRQGATAAAARKSKSA